MERRKKDHVVFMKRKECTLFIVLFLFFACGGPSLPEEVEKFYSDLPEHIDFNIHVKPILSDKCFACHGPDKAKIKGGLQLHDEEKALAELTGSEGKFAIKAGNLNRSEVFHRIISTEANKMMPPPEFKVVLTDYEKAVLVKWIEDGAEYKKHWAFIKPRIAHPSKSKSKAFSNNDIDEFIVKKHDEFQLEMSKPADKELLLRRLSFDLTGLPPSLDEIQAFLNDPSEKAYENQVDRLLGSKHFGEKFASDWADVARYSDTYGYQVDRYRDMSPWRDWVIEAFNNNMPYDKFITWQLAGDLLDNPTKEQIIATGFNRLHPLNMEDGIIGEEYRVESVSDRVAVLGDGILGLTLSCAKCHDHKYDPISQKEYYELYGFFNNINETGQISWDKATPPPVISLPTKRQSELIQNFEDQLRVRKQELIDISEDEKDDISAWIKKSNIKEIEKEKPTDGLVGYYPLEGELVNTINLRQKPRMNREFSAHEVPSFVLGYKGKGILLDGDAWLDCKEVGIFKRSNEFSIGLWVFIPKETSEGVIFHKNKGTTLHSFRGYHLYLKENKLEWAMARTYPENAIIEISEKEIPKEEWVQLMVTYDGSSTAEGCKIYVNGDVVKTQIIKDNLTKDIIFDNLEDIIYAEPLEPNLKVGARWRGIGLKQSIIDEVLVYNRALTAVEIALLVKNKEYDFSDESLREYYLSKHSSKYKASKYELASLRAAYVDSMENVKEMMVMKEMEVPRKTFVLNRGVYDDYGEEVFPNTPKSVLEMLDGMPRTRLGLAQWVVHEDNPLTARVAVNRYWQNFFGRGLVKTAQDFGNQGELPSHPELLDWLALNFMENDWNVKAILKLIVMSSTYRQSSFASTELLEFDPENKWLARGPSMRLSSEMIRDNALSASGLINKKIGGESVYPYQPEGLWAMNFDPYPQDSGDKLYRRSLYTMWRRSNPNPTLSIFDQPDRNLCTVKRQKTNTPLQALVLLNDPTYLEATKVIGEKMTRFGNFKEGIIEAFKLLTGRSPKNKEVSLLLELAEKEYQSTKSNPEQAAGWLSAGQYQIDPALDKFKIMANTVVASVILNSDATIMKR